MDKEAAAKFLGVSTRTLQRYTTQNKISVTYRHGKTGAEADYNEDELERFKEQQDSATYQPAHTTLNGQSQALTLNQITTTTGIERLATVLQSLHPSLHQRVAIENKPLLKLDEAATLTGLARQTLRKAIDDKKLKAQIVGRAWRIKRADLDLYIKNL
jgi:excisionase family DNA binding protein